VFFCARQTLCEDMTGSPPTPESSPAHPVTIPTHGLTFNVSIFPTCKMHMTSQPQ
jgi:hypothetical protein